MKTKNKKTRIKIYCAIFGVLIAFLVWFLISFFTMSCELAVINDFVFPIGSNLDDLDALSDHDYAVVVDGATLAGANDKNNISNVRPTASTAKMILGLAIMKVKPFNLGEPGDTVTITEEMYERYVWYVNHNGSNTKVAIGEEISEYDSLVAVLLSSSNNMADSLAIWAFGSLEAYREYATNMIHDFGLSNTTIGIDASGFSDTTTSTAYELAAIGERLLNNPVLADIVAKPNYEIPLAGELSNTNKILGQKGIIGIKTGFIGDTSGYCLITGYRQNEHIITASLLGANTRAESFDENLKIIEKSQSILANTKLVSTNEVIGHLDSWWTGPVKITASQDLDELIWDGALTSSELFMQGDSGTLNLKIADKDYSVSVQAEEYAAAPTFLEKVMHVFGWAKPYETDAQSDDVVDNNTDEKAEDIISEDEPLPEPVDNLAPITNIPSDNCTIKYGYLMLINPNFTVTTDFIDARRSELVSVSSLYGIVEGNPYNGDNLLDAEAAKALNEMVLAYQEEYPGHTFETRSCYRARGTTCGRLCAATGTSDHHTGLTCDLLDPVYGTSLDTDTYDQHVDWQWLYQNSYKYGFIDRFPESWAGGPMSEPLNVDENGSTGLFETWHYRYVGVLPATEIATGKYNNGNYDSLEHYLKMRGLVSNLKNGLCE